MKNAASTQDTKKGGSNVDLAYRVCSLPHHGMECDGIGHYWAVWDEDINRWVPVDGACPHRHANRAIDSYWRFRDEGLSHVDAVAHVRAHGGEL